MATLSNIQLQFYSSQSIMDRLYFEGDSYGGTGDGGLIKALRDLGFTVLSTAVGGSTMTDIRDRMIANAKYIRPCTLIVWDGSHNGFADVESYCDLLVEGLQAAGSDFILVPAAVPYNLGPGADQIAIRDEYETRWPGKVHDWRDAIANTDGVINQNRMLDYPTDQWHLNGAAHGEEAGALAALLE